MIYDSILDLVGNTPLVRLRRLTAGMRCRVVAKLEYLNPGNSVKDRIGIAMIHDAERRGVLKPGGTIIESTSGNTGVGIALVAIQKGYEVIFTINDKQSREKIDLLKALGAEVVVCPTAVAPEDPRSYYSVAKRLSRELPNSFYINQYFNAANPQAHYASTGPEIWRQTEGAVTHFVAGMGTGGTITGVSRYLKEKNPEVRVIGADPVGSVFYDYFHTGKVVEAFSYLVEGIGEDIFPSTMDFSVLDDVIQVCDKDSFLTARRLVREEGLLAGGSAGTAMHAALEVARDLPHDAMVVVILPDSGLKYLSKVFNDEWMKENQFLEPKVKATAEELIRGRKDLPTELLRAQDNDTVLEVFRKMKELEISQVPVYAGEDLVGTLHEDQAISLLLMGKDLAEVRVREVQGPPLPLVSGSTSAEEIGRRLTSGVSAVLVADGYGGHAIVTKYDLLRCLTE